MQTLLTQLSASVTAVKAVSTVHSAVNGIVIGSPFGMLMVSSADAENCAREVCRRSFDTPYSVC